MRELVLLLLVAACSSSSHATSDASGSGSGSACPAFAMLYCDRDQEGLVCTYPKDGGRPTVCTCSSGLFGCNDCGGTPVGACTAGDSCSVSGFENSCACSCGSGGQWVCTKDDPDPNFHCSP